MSNIFEQKWAEAKAAILDGKINPKRKTIEWKHYHTPYDPYLLYYKTALRILQKEKDVMININNQSDNYLNEAMKTIFPFDHERYSSEPLEFVVDIKPESPQDFITYFRWCSSTDDWWSCTSSQFSFKQKGSAALFKLLYGGE